MSCRLYENLISEALDDAVTADERRLLAAHLALCRPCGELAADLAEMRLLLRDDEPVVRDAGSDEALFEHIQERAPGPLGALWSLVRQALPRPGLVTSSAGAGAVVFALGVVSFPPGVTLDRSAPGASAGYALTGGEALRDSGVLTVWDSSVDRIVATVDPEGQAEDDLVERASLRADGRALTSAMDPLSQIQNVRILLFQRIVVKG